MNYRKYLLMPLAAVMLAAGAAVLTLQTVKAGEQKPAEGDIVLRLDRENRDGMPTHFRTSGDAFGTVSSRYQSQMNPDYIPSKKGMADLHISGSAQPSEKESTSLAQCLHNRHTGPVYDIDLREESHGFINGNAVSWYGFRNWANMNRTGRDIMKDEEGRLQQNMGKDVIAYKMTQSGRVKKEEQLSVLRISTEKEVIQPLGIRYVRIPSEDHKWPSEEAVDQFISLYRRLPSDAWLHFHCEEGEGRTTAFMAMTDMIKNPDVPFRDIIYRQHLIGGDDVTYIGSAGTSRSWKLPYEREKAEMARLFYQYVQEQEPQGFHISWSRWLETHGGDK